MKKVFKIGKDISEMHITVQGHKVTLCFAEKADPEVAVLVKRAILGSYTAPQKI